MAVWRTVNPSQVRRGFSLVELMMVAAIISVMAAIAAPRYASALASYRADAAARRIVADLALAQGRAKAQSTTLTVDFDPPAGKYAITGMADPDRPASAYTVDLRAEPYRAALDQAAFGQGTKVNFDGYGIPNKGGTIILHVGSYSKTITVDVYTGAAKIQ